MQVIERDDLKAWLDEGRSFSLVEVLQPEAFQHFHLPQAINVPYRSAGFPEALRMAVPDSRAPVVVYGQGESCELAAEAARLLDGFGYQQVYVYAGGKTDWRTAGLAIEQRR